MKVKHLKNAEDLDGFTDSHGLFLPKNETISIDDVRDTFAWEKIRKSALKWLDNPIGYNHRILVSYPFESPNRDIYVFMDDCFPIQYYIDDNGVKVRYNSRNIKDLYIGYEDKECF